MADMNAQQAVQAAAKPPKRKRGRPKKVKRAPAAAPTVGLPPAVSGQPGAVAQADDRQTDRVCLHLPMGPKPSGDYYTRRIDISKLTRLQAEALQQLKAGLNAQDTRLISGRHVDSVTDAVRYLLEALALEQLANHPQT